MMGLIFPYAATTRGVTVRVAPRYLPDQSEPRLSHYVWSYHVRVENGGADDVQLIARRWEITDGDGHREVVEGPGVVGQQPVIAPGQAYDYVSGCPLATPSGTMVGVYRMRGVDGAFDAAIPAFALEYPAHKPSLN